MTELALLLESSTWENITRTHYYKRSTRWGGVDVTTNFWRSNRPGTFEKGISKWSFRQVLLKRNMSNQASDTFLKRYCANWSPTLLLSHTQGLSRACYLGRRLEKVQQPGRHCTGKHTESHLLSLQASTLRFPVAPAAAWSLQDPTQSCCSCSDWRNSFKTSKLLIS